MTPPIGSAAWIDAELRARLGEGATIGEIAFEGRLVVITGARVPMGAMVIAVDRAEVELGKGAPLGTLPLSLRLVTLRGSITMEAHALEAPIDLVASDPDAPRWFVGSATTRGATIGGAAFEVDLMIDVAAEGARIAGRVRVADATVFGDDAMSAVPAIEIDLATHGDLEALSVRGRVFAPRIAVGLRSAPGAACRFDDVSAVVDVDRRRLRYRDFSARAHGARIAGWGRVPFVEPTVEAASVPLAAITFERAGGGLFASIAGLAGITVRASRAPIADPEVRAIPSDLTASGEIVVMRDRAISGAMIFTTLQSELRLRIAPTTGVLEGSTLRGRLGVEDGIILGIFRGPVRPRPATILDVDMRLTGSVRAPGITGRVAAPRVVVDVSGNASHPSFTLEDVSALIDVNRDLFAWHRFAGRFYKGTFTCSGRIGEGLEAKLGFDGVRIEDLPTQAEGESKIALLMTGAASGEITLTRHAIEGADLSARGHISILEPRYLAVRRFAPDLARLGLPALRTRGRTPLAMRVAWVHDQLIVDQITGALDGVEGSGNLRVRLDGRLDGALVLHVLESYLAKSALLAVPAALTGRVAVPITIGGTVEAPDVQTNARAIVEELLVDNRVGDAVKSVLDSLGEWSGARKRKDR